MGLDEYNRKRNFAVTREPPGEAPGPDAANRRARAFVIQKHAATRLHYDFRLELEGVLKSWSVPKGPSLDSKVKRLAMRTEDHPLAYAAFEGIIPKGEYGGGTVLLWDQGTWEPQGDAHKDFAAGNLKFILKGEKLRGGFALVKIRGRGPRRQDDDRAWLLIKERDAETRDEAAGIITDERPESVTTRRTLEEIAADRGKVWHSNRDPVDAGSAPGARVAAMPKALRPPQPAARKQPVAGDGWLHEIAVEGERLLARAAGGEIHLLDAGGKALAAAAARKRQAVADAVRLLPAQTLIVDGFLAAVGPDGRADPTALPDALAGRGPTTLTYYLFDLPYLDSHDLRAVPLVRRKALLRELVRKVAERTCLRDLEHVTGSGAEFQRAARGLGIRFMLSRLADSRYDARAGWITVPCAEPPPATSPARRRVSGKA